MDNRILNEVKRNRKLMGITESEINEQFLKSVKLGIKKGLEKAKDFINDKILKIKKEGGNNEGDEPSNNELMFDGNLSGLEFEVYEDYTIFKEKSYNANMAQTMGIAALEGLGFSYPEAVKYFEGYEIDKATITDFEGNQHKGDYAVFKIPTDVVRKVLNIEE